MRDNNGVCHVRYYKNRTKKGNPTSRKARNSFLYYDRKRNVERGVWHSQNGAVSTPDVLTWTADSALTMPYTYTLVLSVRDADLTPEQFQKVMHTVRDEINDFRLITHSDTEHTHAHVLVFSDKKWSRAQFDRVTQTVRSELHTLEQAWLREREQEWKAAVEADITQDDQSPYIEHDDEYDLDIDF